MKTDVFNYQLIWFCHFCLFPKNNQSDSVYNLLRHSVCKEFRLFSIRPRKSGDLTFRLFFYFRVKLSLEPFWQRIFPFWNHPSTCYEQFGYLIRNRSFLQLGVGHNYEISHFRQFVLCIVIQNEVRLPRCFAQNLTA